MQFFPGFPYLLRLVHTVTHLPLTLSAFLLNFAFLVLLVGAVMAICRRMGLSVFTTVLASLAVSCAPLSVVYHMPYAEAAFVAISLWAVVALIDNRWVEAGILVFIAAPFSLTSLGLVAVFALTVFIRERGNLEAWLWVVVSAIPAVAYLWFANRHLSGAGGYVGILRDGWGSILDFGATLVEWPVMVLAKEDGIGHFFAALAMLLVPVLLVYSSKRLPLSAWLYCLITSLSVLLSAGIDSSRPRLLLPVAILVIPIVAACARKLGTRQAILITMGWTLFGAWYSAFMLTTFPYAI